MHLKQFDELMELLEGTPQDVDLALEIIKNNFDNLSDEQIMLIYRLPYITVGYKIHNAHRLFDRLFNHRVSCILSGVEYKQSKYIHIYER